MRPINQFDKMLGMSVPVTFIRDYQKPSTAGGRIIRAGTFMYTTEAKAREWVAGGYVRIEFRDEEE